MRVLDHEPHAWFLLEDDSVFYLDAHCSHSAVDFSVLVALNATERAAYEACGNGYLDRLAHDIHYSAPGVRGSRSLYQARNLTLLPATRAVGTMRRSRLGAPIRAPKEAPIAAIRLSPLT